MLREEDFFYFGKFAKPHGIKGEITIISENYTLSDDCDYITCMIDGILVPFFIEHSRPKNQDTTIVKLEKIDSLEDVRYLTNMEAYLPKQWIEEESEEQNSEDLFIDFEVRDSRQGYLGTIVDIDTTTINTLFVIIGEDGEEILIPAAEEFICNIDHKKRVINMELPEGLLSN